jgi:GNAT superfamily N-acetyltransferase
MAVHPNHQKKGLGDAILKALLVKIKSDAPADGEPYISLLADGPGRPLYVKNGFVESAPGSIGMILKS